MISITEYQKNLSQKTLKRINLVHGEEEYLVKTLLDKLRDLYPVSIIWGDEVSLQDFERTITTGGMFGKEEILFIYKAMDLLGDIKDHKRGCHIHVRVAGHIVVFLTSYKTITFVQNFKHTFDKV